MLSVGVQTVHRSSLLAGRSRIIVEMAEPNARQIRFDQMIESCTLPGAALHCVDDRRIRTLLNGVNAAVENEKVYDAFKIVYEDLGPVRLAGDLVFRTLAKEASAAQKRELECRATPVAEGEWELQLNRARQVFELLDADGSGAVDMDELSAASPALLSLVRNGEDDADDADLVARLMAADENNDGVITFVEFVASSARPGLSLSEATDERVASLLEERESPPSSERTAERRARRAYKVGANEARFDAMLLECTEWEAAICGPSPLEACEVGNAGPAAESGRMELVLRGAFEGARMPAVVEALKAVYVDYALIRVAGNLIFKLMGRVVEKVKRRNAR